MFIHDGTSYKRVAPVGVKGILTNGLYMPRVENLMFNMDKAFLSELDLTGVNKKSTFVSDPNFNANVNLRDGETILTALPTAGSFRVHPDGGAYLAKAKDSINIQIPAGVITHEAGLTAFVDVHYPVISDQFKGVLADNVTGTRLEVTATGLAIYTQAPILSGTVPLMTFDRTQRFKAAMIARKASETSTELILICDKEAVSRSFVIDSINIINPQFYLHRKGAGAGFGGIADGRFYQVAIWNIALDESEIRRMFSNT